ncbi:MAG: hypothetical protein BGO98_18640 [Myxococcales bacterium 68-20]|nr:hypothetical protein [Myxococcales bacterium]OJY24661.1 MAG: hypothetical protein BGO98_18640 [Myxococcales bacterium 68-20]
MPTTLAPAPGTSSAARVTLAEVARRFGPCLIVTLVFLPARDTLFGGDFGHDSEAAMARMKKIPTSSLRAS